VNQADGPVVAEGARVGAFWEQGQHSLVEAVETAATKLEELLEDVDDVVLDGAPTRAK
jgi:hypothetical protein